MSYPRDSRAQPSQVPSQHASSTSSHGESAPGVRPVTRDAGCDLLLWRNPIETGKVFGLSLVVLLILKKVNLITFFLRVLYTVVLTTGAIEFVSKFVLGQGLVSKYGLKQCPNVVGFLRPRIDSLLQQLPAIQSKLRQLVFADEPKKNLQAGIAFYFLHKFFSWFSVWTIVFLGVISAFTLPLVYHTHQAEIDSAVEHGVKVARAKSAEISQIASEKSHPYLEKLDTKLGPVSKFVKTQYANANRASAGAHTTSSAAPHATTADLAAKVPFEPEQHQDTYVSGHAPSATSASTRGNAAARPSTAERSFPSAGSDTSYHPYESYNLKDSSNAQQTGGSPSTHHHLSDLNQALDNEFGTQDESAHKFPNVPTSNPLSGSTDNEFSVDQLQNELKQNKDSLAQELNFNKH
ncbi:RTN2 (YDL204W) and RTN1 (YDR233C) [Zygosaccharomyces parabailii]|nr:RTN2 (YDL204W) and RTN1 (YDR233C) [Zygosaccharomyces parabailii]